MRLSKVEILDRFRTCCQKLGKTPGRTTFSKAANVPVADIRYHWGRFSNLVTTGGATPQAWRIKIPETEVFVKYAKICTHLGKIPTSDELRIAARDLKTPMATVYGKRFGSIGEFDRRFKSWIEAQQNEEIRQILVFPGWGRQTAPRRRAQLSREPSAARYSFYPYLPACLQDLDVLAMGDVPSNENPGESAPLLFERRCADAFRCLGLEVTNLGQGKGRAADCLAIAQRERFALIIDAKVRRDGYVLGTEDRKFLEYANNHGKELQSKGFDKLYLVVVATSFKDRDLDQLTAYLSNSPIRSVTMVTVKALIRIVEDSIRERHSFSLENLAKVFFGHKIINA